MAVAATLGARIAQARREMGVREHRDVTQLDLAQAVGVANATLSRWEADLASPREDALGKLAAYLGVTPAYLRYGVRDSTAGLDPRVTTGELPAVDLQRTPQVDVFESQGIEKPAPPVEKGGRRFGNGGRKR